MLWKRLFSSVPSLEADEVRQYIAQHQEGTYDLIDVRQPGEYEKAHIPGARLIPLADLGNSLDKLDREKPTIVY
jgi:sulfur-carrier protein adenylyltransferase/sulfurtransferase